MSAGRRMKVWTIALMLGGATVGPLPVSAQVQFAPGQRPPFQAAVEGLLEAIMDPAPERVRAFAEAHLTREYRESMPLEQHIAKLQELRLALGRAELGNLMAPAPDERIATVRSSVNGETYQLRFSVSPETPPKIAGIALERGDAGAPAAPAAAPATAPATVTADARRDVLNALYAALENQYVSPDTARLIADHIRAREATGAYVNLSDATELGRALTADLRAINGDLHLSVRPAQNMRPPAALSSPFGFEKIERLPGNIGYIQIRGVLGGPDRVFDVATEALRTVADADAIIIDLRENSGAAASPRGSILEYVVSHFLPPDTHILSTYQRATGRNSEVRTLREVDGPRRLDVPLYVLVGPGTASGGEYIAFVLQSQGRATVIGQRSAGAGRRVAYFPLPHGFVSGISVNRTWDPRTGGGWEITGVTPDVEVPVGDALATAIRLIVR